MGLDTSHNCWHGPYSAFMRFRREIARTIGVHLDAMQGFSGNAPCVLWSALKPDPLHVLLNHSDCDGTIEHQDCKPIADRLYEIMPLLPEGTDGAGYNWREQAKQFADGLMAAHASGESVEFR